MAPLLPPVLFWRVIRNQVRRGAPLGRLARVGPAALLLVTAWAAGEALGYATGEP
jgi:hypothetical protein